MNNSINTVITSSIILLGLLASCVSTSTIQISSTTSPIPTISNTPIPEITPTLSVTTTPKIKPSLTTVSIQYFRLGSPFAADLGTEYQEFGATMLTMPPGMQIVMMIVMDMWIGLYL